MIISYSPVVLQVPDRPVELQIRVTAPAEGADLPVILLSHGHGFANNLSSLNGYAPIANHWAERGFVVVQPTHLSSRTLTSQVSDAPGAPYFWRSRAEDMSQILDQFDAIESATHLTGRVNRDHVAVAGHSLGGFTATQLLGARITDPATHEVVDLREPRIQQGIVFAAPGRGDVLNGPMAEAIDFVREIDFSTMVTPALVVIGDKDDSQHFTDLGPEWHADPYLLAPAPKTLPTVYGAEHLLGGIQGYDAAETTDEDPERVAAIARLSAAYLDTQFGRDPHAWTAATAELSALAGAESK